MIKQRGATLVELMLTLSLMGVITVSMFAQRSSEMDVVMAKGLGTQLLQYNNAVQSFIADNPNGTYPLPRSGTAWLKHTSCPGGQSPISYLPCDFPRFDTEGAIKLGDMMISTRLTRQTVSGNTFIQAATDTTPIRYNNVNRADLAGISALVAASGGSGTGSPNPLMTNSSFGSNPQTARVTMTASSARSQDAWLRTDGSNRMSGNIVFDPANPITNREVLGVATVQGRGSERLSIQSSTNNSGIDVEPNRSAARSGSSLFEITPTRSLTRVGTASTEVGSGAVTNKAGTASTRVNSSSVLNQVGSRASTEVSSTGVINKVDSNSVEVSSSQATTRGDHQITGFMSTGRNSDINFSPLKSSGSSINIDGYFTMDGTMFLGGNATLPGTLQARYIWANTYTSAGLSVTPSGSSTFQNMIVKGELLFTKTYPRGSSCSSNKMLGRANSGEVMFCRGGRWREVQYE